MNILKRIPKGLYCYNDKGVCPHWGIDPSAPTQENGYCLYLGKTDWDLNEEPIIPWMETRVDGEVTRVDFDPPKSPHELGLTNSLLWDQCKECDVP